MSARHRKARVGNLVDEVEALRVTTRQLAREVTILGDQKHIDHEQVVAYGVGGYWPDGRTGTEPFANVESAMAHGFVVTGLRWREKPPAHEFAPDCCTRLMHEHRFNTEG